MLLLLFVTSVLFHNLLHSFTLLLLEVAAFTYFFPCMMTKDWPAPYFDNILNHNQSSLLISEPPQVLIKATAGQQVVCGSVQILFTTTITCKEPFSKVQSIYSCCECFHHLGLFQARLYIWLLCIHAASLCVWLCCLCLLCMCYPIR